MPVVSTARKWFVGNIEVKYAKKKRNRQEDKIKSRKDSEIERQ